MSIDGAKLTGKFTSSISTDRPRSRCVLQDWVQQLSMMQQTVLLTAIRGPDGIGKYHPCKMMLRWYRRCVLLSAMDGRVLSNPADLNGGSFTGPSYTPADGNYIPTWLVWHIEMEKVIHDYLRATDELPHHFQMHFMHAAQILGYKHPDIDIRKWWLHVYSRLVNDLHLHPETEDEMDRRLGDSREQWLERNDPATVE